MQKKLFRKLKYFRFLYTKSVDFQSCFSEDRNRCLLITIAFNNSEFIHYQILLLKKYFRDEFSHCIVDNSSDGNQKSAIKNCCISNDVSYYDVPPNPYKNTKSHGAAMHWAYFQLIKKFSFRYFGFLDHDIFPIAEFCLKDKLEQGIFGRVIHAYHEKGYQEIATDEVPYWSLWAGLCFFESARLKACFPWTFNFFSKHFPEGYFLDTGGGLWNLLYSKLNYPSNSASFEEVEIDKFFGDGNQQEKFEILDRSWVHFVSLSNWRTISDLESKKRKMIEYLETYL
jgi:hypothetical protein